ncbi:S-layer homology domain-containing protein, partial [Candidatus Pseudoscillospira sp. SGI.172]|uniref:S-layer homology domain-containing protein n=1 Tax=Candidatus Pseudoscillospira sp. SGI.172 TaxID=3420582 RepID=UPI003D0850F9
PPTPTEYTITFNVNGGNGTIPSQTTSGQKLSSLPTATHSGSYSFVGWYTAASGGTQITTAYTFSANTTVYAHWTYTGGGGGGGGSYTPSYTVSVDKTVNGTITVSPKSASKGDTVTITVKPDNGYELDTLKVLDKNGDKVKLTEKNGKYIFTMPTGKVTVKGSFVEETPVQIFKDVPVDAYYYEAVKWAAEKGITGGVGNDLFAPNQPCTRAQIVTFLWRAAGSPAPKNMSSFTDVPADAFYAKAVAWAVENGITGGTGDGKFSPDATCTRAQAVTFLYRASGVPAVSGNAAFSDVATNAYYAAAVKWAEKNGITGGIGGGLFGSDNNCTRAQIVTFLYRNYQSK